MKNEIYGCHYDGPEGKVVKWVVGTTDSTRCPVVGLLAVLSPQVLLPLC